MSLQPWWWVAGVNSNSSKIKLLCTPKIPAEFWAKIKAENLIEQNAPILLCPCLSGEWPSLTHLIDNSVYL